MKVLGPLTDGPPCTIGRFVFDESGQEYGFVPATRRMVYEKLKPLITDNCPFVNLPETGRARWGEILDAEKMKKCVWVRPKLVAVIEFLEWTEGDRLRHSKFVALRDDKNPREVTKEHSGES